MYRVVRRYINFTVDIPRTGSITLNISIRPLLPPPSSPVPNRPPHNVTGVRPADYSSRSSLSLLFSPNPTRCSSRAHPPPRRRSRSNGQTVVPWSRSNPKQLWNAFFSTQHARTRRVARRFLRRRLPSACQMLNFHGRLTSPDTAAGITQTACRPRFSS